MCVLSQPGTNTTRHARLTCIHNPPPASSQAAVVADQNAKLSIFATRPAIYAPFYNFITECMGTVALILLALLIELQVG
jgi:glycerol uptake facilitator-like aquaporin